MNKNGRAMTRRMKNNSDELTNKILKELSLKAQYHNLVDFAEKIHKVNSIKLKENKIRDNEISSINDRIHQLMIENYNLEKSINEKIQLRKQYEQEQKSVSEYCNKLRYNFFHSDEIINNYKTEISNLKKAYENTSKLYDDKIEEIMKENEKLNKRINDRINLFNIQKKQIIESNAKIERLRKELNDQNKLINNRSKLNKEKYQFLKNEFEEMKKKLTFMELENYKETEPSTNVSNESRIILKNNEIKNKEKRLNNKKLTINTDDSYILLTQIDELSRKYKELSTVGTRKGTLSKGKTSTKYKTINTYSKSYY